MADIMCYHAKYIKSIYYAYNIKSSFNQKFHSKFQIFYQEKQIINTG